MTIFNSADVSWGFQAVRSSFCVNGDCIEVQQVGAAFHIRDSKDTESRPQVWDPWEYDDLLKAVAYGVWHEGVQWGSGRFDRVLGLPRHRPIAVSSSDWQAFVEGVRAGDFDRHKLSSPASRAGNSDAGRTAATGAVEPGVVPAPVVAGMNAAGYAAMNVPAGRRDGDASTVDGANLAVAGRPGSQASEYDVDELADFIAEAHTKGMYTGAWSLARWLLSQGYRRDPSLMEAEAAWQRLTAPLVPPLDTSHAAVDMGWASPDGLVNEAGEVGPAHPRLGPTEPADCEQARA